LKKKGDAGEKHGIINSIFLTAFCDFFIKTSRFTEFFMGFLMNR